MTFTFFFCFLLWLDGFTISNTSNVDFHVWRMSTPYLITSATILEMTFNPVKNCSLLLIWQEPISLFL